MGKSVSVLVIAPGESPSVELAADDGTFLRPLRLMGEYVGLDVFDRLPALWEGAPNSLPVTVFPDIAAFRGLRRRTWLGGKGSIV